MEDENEGLCGSSRAIKTPWNKKESYFHPSLNKKISASLERLIIQS